MSASNGAVRLVPADLAAHRSALVELNVEYLTWNEQVCEEYEAAGFVDRDAYEGAEVPKELWPHWRFMELSLR